MNMKLCVSVIAATVGILFAKAEVNVSTDTVLSDDTDWRGQGLVTIAEGATLDLNGHLLQVDALAGAGRITDSQCYEVLDYVQATGQQRVPTGYIPGPSTMVEVDFLSESNSDHTLYGTASWTSNRFLCMVTNNRFFYFGSGKFKDFVNGARHRSVLRNGRISLLQVEGCKEIGYVEAGQTNTDGTELNFFGIDNTTAPHFGYYKFYAGRIWHDTALKFDLVPARNAVTGEVGLFNRVNGTLLTSCTEAPLVAGAATGATLGIGSLRVAATGGASLTGFTGTIDASVRRFVDGTFALSEDADWRAFGACAIDGQIDLHGFNLTVAALEGIGSITDSNDCFDRLEYVECTNKQRVLTGITPGPDTAVELDLMFTSASAAKTCTVLGCKSWTSNRYLMFLDSGKFYFFSNGQYVPSVIDTRCHVTVTPTTSPNGAFTVVNAATGAQIGSTPVVLTNSDNSQMALFSQAEDLSRAGAFRLYSLKITKSGKVARDFTPVRNPQTGEVGLFDAVSGRVYNSNTGVGLVAGPVVSSAASRLGSLHVVVPEGQARVNAGLALNGSLTLVKEGAGSLMVMKEGQTYGGGTQIKAGELGLPYGGFSGDFGAENCYLGPMAGDYVEPKSEIIVEPGAVFDIRGNCNYRYFHIVLAGGTVRNSGRNQGFREGSFGTVTLTADSTFDAIRNLTCFDTPPINLQLGGHVLTVDTHDQSELFFQNQAIVTNGTLSLIGGGNFHAYNPIDARTAELRVATSMCLDKQVDVGDYYAACTVNRNAGAGAMNVYGRFTPATDYFYGCTLQNGSTLDLTAHEGVWSTQSAFTDGITRVTFAEGATVTIDVHGRRVWAGQIVNWGEGNAPTDVTFKLDDESRALGRSLYVTENGLYATGGVVIILR